ncbi:unnamed protein product, partial [Mesorhabditis belari]|uniref:EF-hand domain-containing protein n=1 Tax=Mesorhabditis belari TaxID=2138241 RepID=A0AAF3EYN5_9BILA
MGNSHSNGTNLMSSDIERLMRETGFSRDQLKHLYVRFCYIDKKGRGYLTPEDFTAISELTLNPLGARIVGTLFTHAGCEEPKMVFRQFVHVLSTFRPIDNHSRTLVNAKIQKMRFAFEICDVDGNGYITRNDFRKTLAKVLGTKIPIDRIDQIFDLSISESDGDQDEKISFNEFCKAMDNVEVVKRMSIYL